MLVMIKPLAYLSAIQFGQISAIRGGRVMTSPETHPMQWEYFQGIAPVLKASSEGMKEALEKATLGFEDLFPILLLGLSASTGKPMTDLTILPGDLGGAPLELDQFLSGFLVKIRMLKKGLDVPESSQ